MQFAISREDETLSKLVQRLFRHASSAERKRITGLIQDSNPDLKARKRIPKGTVIVIPQVDGFEPSSDVRTERQIAASLIRTAREQMGDLGPILSQLVDRQEQEAQETLQLQKSRDVRRIAGKEAFVRDRLAIVNKDAKERLKRSTKLRSVIAKAESEIESDLNNLLKMVDPTTAPPPPKS